MINLSDYIENYLKEKLSLSIEGQISIQRNDLAEKFSCVPSQINYVLSTRFTLERGYLVESRRGGRGFIKIEKLSISSENDGKIIEIINGSVGLQISQQKAENLIIRLYEDNIITQREAKIIQAAMKKEVLQVNLPWRDKLRANLLKVMLIPVIRKY